MNRQRWVLALTGLASFMVALDALVVTTALSAIRADLGASIGQLEWTVNAYVLSFAVLIMTAAALGDRLGRRSVFATGLGLFTAASAACALAPGIGWLIAARAIQGAGAALVMPLALALLGAAFPPERRGRAIGIFSSFAGLSVLCGPLVGGAAVEGLAWPWIFWINVPIGLLTLALTLTRVEESRGASTALDVRGLALVTGAAFGIVWGLVRASSSGWGSVEVVASLALGALLTAAFVGYERRAREPMLPMGLFRSRAFSAGNAAMFFMWASGLGTLFFMAQFFQATLGYGPLDTGLRLMPWGACTVVVAQVSGRLINRVGERALVAGGLALQAGCMAWTAAIAEPGLAYGEIVAPLVLSGIGFALAIPAIQSAVLGAVAPQNIGKASGTLTTMRQLGGAFGVAVLAAVFAGAGSYASAQAFADGFVAASGGSAALALCGAVAALALPAARAGRATGPAAGITPGATTPAGTVAAQAGGRSGA
jgi:EmrB/QacA subfamily drug resistance transporter